MPVYRVWTLGVISLSLRGGPSEAHGPQVWVKAKTKAVRSVSDSRPLDSKGSWL